tara:strand:+ start:324 stop:551 length:228 start_codon:yes stop_codon:yes gene_type:complete
MSKDKSLSSQVGGNHYRDCLIQPAEYISANGLNFFEGNIVKYITRHRTKGRAEDIKKIIQYAEMILEFDYPDKGE